MHPSHKLQHLLYQTRFTQTLEEIQTFGDQLANAPSTALIKSTALFELHRVPEAKATTSNLRTDDATTLYLHGKIAYMDGNNAKALQHFSQMQQIATSVQDKTRALLGLANTHYSNLDQDSCTQCLLELNQLETGEAAEELSKKILFVNVATQWSTDYDTALDICHDIMAESTKLGWQYFHYRGLIAQANVYQKMGKLAQMETTLEILRAQLRNTECYFLKFQIADTFKDQNVFVDDDFEIDEQRLQIRLQDRWIDLQDRPRIFSFISFLAKRSTFVQKEEIAATIWEDETYNPICHDARIFDLARRARALIEKYSEQPIYLLSGRSGFRLSATNNPRRQK